MTGDSAETVAELARTVTEALPTVPLDTVLDSLLAEDTTPRDVLRGLRLLESAYPTAATKGHPGPAAPGPTAPDRGGTAATPSGVTGAADHHPVRIPTADHDAELGQLVVARKDEETELDYMINNFA